MKKFFAAALLAITGACVPHSPKSTTAEVIPLRELELVLHADCAFNEKGRRLILDAAENVGKLTRYRARLSVVFDLDFDSISDLKEHVSAGDSLVMGIMSDSDTTLAIDEALHTPGRVLGATVNTNVGSQFVLLILDRIEENKFESVVTHEFGHVIGLPDLKELGSVMSGSSRREDPPSVEWTKEDIDACRGIGYCD